MPAGEILGVPLQREARSFQNQRLGSATAIEPRWRDHVTQLPGRVFISRRLDALLGDSRRSEAPFALWLVDLDRFHELNALIGSKNADLVLREIARRLGQIPGVVDLCRTGDDEFAMLALSSVVPAEIQRMADEAFGLLDQPVEVSGAYLRVSSSIGIALGPGDFETASDVLSAAAGALKRAKSSGGSTFRIGRSVDHGVAGRVRRRQEVAGAVEAGQLEVFYQPQIDVESGVLVGMEALARWCHPVDGLLPPDEFIPLAEENLAIVGIGEFVLAEAIRFRRELVAQNGLSSAFSVAVNVSALQLERSWAYGRLLELIQQLRPGECELELELTESSVIQNAELMRRRLQGLVDQGVRVALDDFGTGHSCLANLQDLPLDSIKVDRRFVQRLGQRGGRPGIATAVIALARGLDLGVVAEGVETVSQLEALRVAGCRLVQGYLFGKPMPEGEFRDWVRSEGSAEETLPVTAVV